MYIKDKLKQFKPRELNKFLGLTKVEFITLDYKFKNNTFRIIDVVEWYKKCGVEIEDFDLHITYSNGHKEVKNLLKVSKLEKKIVDFTNTAELIDAKIKFIINYEEVDLIYKK